MAFACMAITTQAAPTTTTMNIGIMNLQEVIQQSPQLVSIKSKLKKQFDSKEQSITSAQKSLQTEITKMHKDASVMKPAERKALQEKIAKNQQQLQTMQLSFQQEYVAARDKELAGLFKEVKAVVDGIAKKQNFDLILTNEPVAYADDGLDITKEVVSALNSKS